MEECNHEPVALKSVSLAVTTPHPISFANDVLVFGMFFSYP